MPDHINIVEDNAIDRMVNERSVFIECARAINRLLSANSPIEEAISLEVARDIADIMETFDTSRQGSLNACQINLQVLCQRDSRIARMLPTIAAFFGHQE